eukprot:gene12540-3235_t
MASKPGESINLVIKWSGKEYNIDNISSSNTVADLKQAIKDRTCVLPERQKLLGLKYKGKPPGNDVKLGALSVKPGMKIMMMGTAEENLETIIKPPEDVIKLKIKEDEDIGDEEVALENREEFLAKVQRRVASYQIKVLNEPRPGKKLLVLDVDYTLFDHKSVAETGFDLMRPYLHEFLTSAYDCYDIVIWLAFSTLSTVTSTLCVDEGIPYRLLWPFYILGRLEAIVCLCSNCQIAVQELLYLTKAKFLSTDAATSMKWIEAKMQELGVTNNPNYKIMFMLDSDAMITVQSPTYGIIETKPLGVIWGKYAQYSSKNSIIIDDLRRNFLMNPSNGLKIRPFRNAHASRATDQELLRISKYLKKIATLEDFAKLDHRNWERDEFKKEIARDGSDRNIPKITLKEISDNDEIGDGEDLQLHYEQICELVRKVELSIDRTIRSNVGRRKNTKRDYNANKKEVKKAYIVLFTCSSTRAVHLTLCKDITTEEFKRTLKWFVVRRGKPHLMVSDNAKTFQATKKWWESLQNNEEINGFLASQSIKWVFNLSRAPWWGGFFERLIGVMKSAFSKVIGIALLKCAELEETLLDVECFMNNRPLTYIADVARRLRYMKRCKEQLRRRWISEYLNALKERKITQDASEENKLNTGRVVLIKERVNGRLVELKVKSLVVLELSEGTEYAQEMATSSKDHYSQLQILRLVVTFYRRTKTKKGSDLNPAAESLYHMVEAEESQKKLH